MAEETRFNKIFDLIMIAGEPDSAAPFVGISAQLDEFQEFLGEEFSSMSGEEDATNAPELWEAQKLNSADAVKDYEEQIKFLLSDDSESRGLSASENDNPQERLYRFLLQAFEHAPDDLDSQRRLRELIERIHAGHRGLNEDDDPHDIYSRERLEQLITQMSADDSEQNSVKSRIFGVDDALLIGIISVAGPILWDVVKSPKFQNFAKKGIAFIPKVTKSAWRFVTGGNLVQKSGDALKKTTKNILAKENLVSNLLDGASTASTTAMMLTQQVGDAVAQLTCMLQMVGQIKSGADIMRVFTPSLAQLYDEFVMLDDAVDQLRLEDNGNTTDTTIPQPEAVNIENLPYTMEQLLTMVAKGEPIPELQNRDIKNSGTPTEPTEPTEPKKPTSPGKRSVAVPRIKAFSATDALRYICRELSILEKEFKIFNSHMAMDKDEIPKFLAGKESTIITKDIGMAEILFRALNTAGKEVSEKGIVGPTEILSLAEQFKQAFPVVEVVDTITKKKSTVSVFELIMKAQDAKVVELGPGFLKWYTELDVFQHSTGAVVETPTVGN